MKLVSKITLLGLLPLAAVLRAEIELTAVFITADQARFSLTDTATGPARWVATGQTFAGFEVGAYDAKTETLTLTKGGERLPVRLKAATIKAGFLSVDGTIALGEGEQMTVTDATLVFGQESVFPVKDGITLRVKPQLRPDGNILYSAAFERMGSDGKLEKLGAPSVIARPSQEFRVQTGALGFAFKPKGVTP